MNKQHDALTVALTGQLSIVLIAAAILALAASLFLLRRYRRAVIRSMQRRTPSEISTLTGFLPPGEPLKPPETMPPFTFVNTDTLSSTILKNKFLYKAIRLRPWLVAMVYTGAGLGIAHTLTA